MRFNTGLYQFLMQSYARKGFLTQNEVNQVRKINQIYQELQNQKTLVDNDLWNEMTTTGFSNRSKNDFYDFVLYLLNKYDNNHFLSFHLL